MAYNPRTGRYEPDAPLGLANRGQPQPQPGLLNQPPENQGGFDVEGAMRNIYGNGGPGDALVALGAGLMTRRNVGEGLLQGLQTVQSQQALSNQRELMNARIKALQARAGQPEYGTVTSGGKALYFDKNNPGAGAQPIPGVPEAPQAHWAAPNEVPAALQSKPVWIDASGVPHVQNVAEPVDEGQKLSRTVNARKEQGAAMGLQGDALNAYALTGNLQNPNEKVTNDQANAALFAGRMKAANEIVNDPKVWQSGTGWGGAMNKTLDAIPVAGNAMVSSNYQQYRQAQDDFINAVLRRESGAAISQSEYTHAYKQYFPQPGDGDEVIRQKAANRENAIKGIMGATAPSFQKSQNKVPNLGWSIEGR